MEDVSISTLSAPPLPAVPKAIVKPRGKGKVHAEPAPMPATPIDKPYALRGRKRRATDEPLVDISSGSGDDNEGEDEITLKKAEGPTRAVVPRVQVDDASPTQSGQDIPDEVPVHVATGKVRRDSIAQHHGYAHSLSGYVWAMHSEGQGGMQVSRWYKASQNSMHNVR